METTEKLDLLSELQKEVETLNYEQQARLNSAIPEEIKTKLADINAEYVEKLLVVSNKIANLETEVRQDVLHIGSTVRGKFLLAIWNKGKTTWDTDGLNGYAVAHPEISIFKKPHEPTVTIRKNTKGE